MGVVLIGDDGVTVEVGPGVGVLPLTVLSPEFPGNAGTLPHRPFRTPPGDVRWH